MGIGFFTRNKGSRAHEAISKSQVDPLGTEALDTSTRGEIVGDEFAYKPRETGRMSSFVKKGADAVQGVPSNNVGTDYGLQYIDKESAPVYDQERADKLKKQAKIVAIFRGVDALANLAVSFGGGVVAKPGEYWSPADELNKMNQDSREELERWRARNTDIDMKNAAISNAGAQMKFTQEQARQASEDRFALSDQQNEFITSENDKKQAAEKDLIELRGKEERKTNNSRISATEAANRRTASEKSKLTYDGLADNLRLDLKAVSDQEEEIRDRMASQDYEMLSQDVKDEDKARLEALKGEKMRISKLKTDTDMAFANSLGLSKDEQPSFEAAEPTQDEQVMIVQTAQALNGKDKNGILQSVSQLTYGGASVLDMPMTISDKVKETPTLRELINDPDTSPELINQIIRNNILKRGNR